MNVSILQNKTNDEIYSIITSLSHVSLSKMMKKMAKMPKWKQEQYKRIILWHIPGGMKIQGIKAVELVKEYIKNYKPSSGDSDSDALINLINQRLQSAHDKIDEGKDDELTQDEIDALGADENQDGEITLSPLYDIDNQPLSTNDDKNSEIQVFE